MKKRVVVKLVFGAALSISAIYLLLLPFPTLCAAESPTPEKIAAIIEKAKILEVGYKVVAVVNGSEVIVSTYRNNDARDLNKDCKIDAALIAKELMLSNNLGIHRVKVHFHEPALSGDYREVTVNIAEIKGFGAGAVSQEEFLDSLAITMLPEAGAHATDKNNVDETSASRGNTPTDGSAGDASGKKPTTGDGDPPKLASGAKPTGEGGTTATTNVPIAGVETKSAPSKTGETKVAALRRQRFVDERIGISFDIPKGWRVEGNLQRTSTVFRLSSDQTGQSNISLSLEKNPKTTAQLVALQAQTFNYPEAQRQRYGMTHFGKGQYNGALFVVKYPNWDAAQGKPYYEMLLFAGKPGAIYTLRGWASEGNYSLVGPAFFDVMTTIAFPNTAGVATTATAPAGGREK